jgi:hypothetical protein
VVLVRQVCVQLFLVAAVAILIAGHLQKV